MSKILIVEDDLSIQALLHDFIQEAGHSVILASDGVEALAKYSEQDFDLVLLDIMLPKIDGYGVCEVIRQKSDVPIIMLTALDGEENQIRGLDLQADDYITKPFSMPVLLMKIAAVLKRSEGVSRQIYVNGELLYDFENKTLTRRGEQVELTALECRLTELFLRNRGIVLTRERILERIWDADERFVESRTLNVTIRRLRMKVEENPEEPIYIKTVFGLGYKWEDGQK